MSSKTWGSVVVALAAVMAMPVAAAHADGCSTSAGTTTCTYTGADTTDSLTIPSGVSSVTVSATGASGQAGHAGRDFVVGCTQVAGSQGGAGGQAANVTGSLAVTPGDVLSIVVGSTTHSMHGGFGGDGVSGAQCDGVGGSGGAGGGASYISRGSTFLVVAGGGGGGGGGGNNSSNCSPGAKGGDRDQNGGDRMAGTCTAFPTTWGGGGAADSTSDGNGADGLQSNFTGLGGGGGGGGGVNGGGGGDSGLLDGGAGGGGGGSKVPPSGSISTVSGSPTPQVTISYVSDATPPTTTIALSPASPNGTGGWYTSAVGVTISAADSGSGVAQTRCVLDPGTTPGTFSDLPTTPCPYLGAGALVSSDGVHAVYAASIDNAGNPEAVTRATFTIDATAPTISAAAATSANPSGWYRGDVTVHFTCADAGSGIPSGACPLDQTLTGEGAAVSSTSQTVTDAAGNISAASNTVTVKIDRTAPTDAPAVTAGTVGQNGWYVSDVSVDWHWSDGLSGVDPSHCTQTSASSGEGPAVSVSSACADLAGNGASDAQTFKIDKTAPTVTCQSPPTFVLGSTGNQVKATVSDTGSGANSPTVAASAPAATAGSHSVALTGTDLAGNTTTVSCTYVVGYGVGRFALGPPIVRAGGPVVLEFTLVGANGRPISDADARSLVGQGCTIAVHVSVGGPISGCPTYSDHDREFHFAFRTNLGMAGPNGASFTVTIGSAVVATSPVRHFLVVVPYRHGRRLAHTRH